jgi:hypothetical protein
MPVKNILKTRVNLLILLAKGREYQTGYCAQESAAFFLSVRVSGYILNNLAAIHLQPAYRL